MFRYIVNDLVEWLHKADRKPLIIRGARQVGKTWLARHLAEKESLTLLELNLERDPALQSIFDSNHPKDILLNLETFFGKKIEINQTLLFIDEIQAYPEMLAKLRWLAESMPELPVIAAGSLLDLILSDFEYSMPVGRISFMYLEPMSFEEFILAKGRETLVDYLQKYTLETNIIDAIHQEFSQLFREYILVGGMPEAVSQWVQTQSIQAVNEIQHNLLATYQSDFSKYKGRFELGRMDSVFNVIPKTIGCKFVYNEVKSDMKAAAVRQILNLFTQARITTLVQATSANGAPLAAEIREKIFKVVLLDTGLYSSLLGVNVRQIKDIAELLFVHEGAIAEHVVGQLLKTLPPYYIDPKLFYWQREKSSSSAEIDYVIQFEDKVVPIEVKAGKTGSLKSLHVFMARKQLKFAIRLNADVPSLTEVKVKLSDGTPVSYQLLSIPFYLIGQLMRLLELYC